MAKKTKSATVPITKVSIENVSKWDTMYAVMKVNGLLQDEEKRDFIMCHRAYGCAFRVLDVGVNISVLPVSKANPADTLFFYIHDRMDGEE